MVMHSFFLSHKSLDKCDNTTGIICSLLDLVQISEYRLPIRQ